MDSQDCLCEKSTSALIKKLESGELTFDVLCQRLRAMIDSELRKPEGEIDADYVVSCQNLLDNLTLSEKYESKQPQYERELIQYIEKNRKTHTIRKRALTAVFTAMALLVLLVVSDGILHREWLEGGSSKDRQQYEVVGKVVDPNLVGKGIATSMVESDQISTNSLEEAESVLGFSPLVPDWYPKDWTLETYYAAKNETMLWFGIALTSVHQENVLMYTISKYDSIKEAQNSFEQSDKGQLHPINGWNVYVSINIDEVIAIWLDNNCCYTLFGALSEEELVKVIESISKGE